MKSVLYMVKVVCGFKVSLNFKLTLKLNIQFLKGCE